MSQAAPTEKLIQNMLYHCFHGIVMMPNSNILEWESDFVVITKALFIHEFEIKRTRSDFFNDKKKWRTKQMEAWLAGQRKYKPWPDYSFLSDVPQPANYFWYVCPAGMITSDELPQNAGLMTFTDHLKTECRARRLHKEKLTMKHILQIANAQNFRYWRYRLNDSACI